jgi:anti-anti-sigma factor
VRRAAAPRSSWFGVCNPRQGEKSMKSEIRDQGDVRIIELSGKITIGTGDVKLKELITSAVEQGKVKILLDLAGVTAIDSSGIGEMVACYTSVTKRGGHLKLLRLSPKINDILQVTQLITVFDVFDNEAEAVASFH